MEESLKQLFEARDEQYKTETNKILKKLANVTTGIEKFFQSIDNSEVGTIIWEDVSLLRMNEITNDQSNDDIFIMMVGSLCYENGATITLPNGDEVTITEETKTYFRKSVRVGIPYDLAVTATVETIIDFIENTIEEMEFDEDGTEIEFDSSERNILEHESSEQFNFDDLTKEQKQSLIMHTNSGSKN